MGDQRGDEGLANLLFSICRFREVTNSYPARITVVSFFFKKHLFQELHAKSIRWPTNAFSFVGIVPSPSNGFNLKSRQGANKRTL
mmetsp:Transcript_13560/g.27746  ORF Transcript_13560/g.27746 Transcript_13560/m.27746 type:complete len:85 (-) Transcript_13560:219-473(-)